MTPPAANPEPPKVQRPKQPLRGRPKLTPHPTAMLLLDAAVELLEEVPADALTIPMILDRSEVSYGSLYHHYADISDLVEQAIVHRYTRHLKDSLQAVRQLLSARDADDFRQRTEELLNRYLDPGLRHNRLDRVEALGALQNRPRLVELIARAQQQVTDEQAELIREFQQRGWARADLDSVALSGFIQGTLLGRIVDDVADRPVDRKTWDAVALTAFRAILFPD